MREIKFRGRDVITGNWAYGFYYPSKGHLIIRDEKDAECIVMPDTVGEFTGLLDKNGKEIYEGDIIEVIIKPKAGYQYLGKVIFDAELAMFGIEFTEEQKWYLSKDLYAFYKTAKVIGNIHEHPHLLKPQP